MGARGTLLASLRYFAGTAWYASPGVVRHYRSGWTESPLEVS